MMEYTVNDNGIRRIMSMEEVQQMKDEMSKLPPPQPTDSQRIADLEAQNAELRRMIEALANGDTGVTA